MHNGAINQMVLIRLKKRIIRLATFCKPVYPENAVACFDVRLGQQCQSIEWLRTKVV